MNTPYGSFGPRGVTPYLEQQRRELEAREYEAQRARFEEAMKEGEIAYAAHLANTGVVSTIRKGLKQCFGRFCGTRRNRNLIPITTKKPVYRRRRSWTPEVPNQAAAAAAGGGGVNYTGQGGKRRTTHRARKARKTRKTHSKK